MKRYRVVVVPRVHDQIEVAFEYIFEQSEQNGIRWLQGIFDVIDTLETMPTRCGFVSEKHGFDREIRQFLYHSHRILFEVDENLGAVRVIEFRHSAQDEW